MEPICQRVFLFLCWKGWFLLSNEVRSVRVGKALRRGLGPIANICRNREVRRVACERNTDYRLASKSWWQDGGIWWVQHAYQLRVDCE